MNWIRETKKSYKHDARIYLLGFAIVISIFLYTAYDHGFDTRPIPYAKCGADICQNPYYGQPCKQQVRILFFIPLYTSQDCTTKEENSWLTQKNLTRGTYGRPPSPMLRYSWGIMFCVLFLTFFANHYTHNKGRPFDIELTVSKKHRYSLTKLWKTKKGE